MGVFYNTICLPGNHRSDVREHLERWLRVRGYEPRESTVLFDLEDSERSAYLLGDASWTILFYSHWDEDRRLIHELQGIGVPVVYLWVHDSDVWGWDLFDTEGFAGSWSSNPRVHHSFPETPVGSVERPAMAIENLCQHLGLDTEASAALARLQGHQGAFQDEICAEFAHLLGISPAATSYDDLERGVSTHFEGWSSEHLFFTRPDDELDTESVDLHQHKVTRWIPGPHTRPDTTQLEIAPELLREMARMRRRQRLAMVWIKPMAWLSRLWHRSAEAWTRLRWSLRTRLRAMERPASWLAETSYRCEGQRLINDRHGCLVDLPEDAAPAPAPSRPPLVFAFRTRRVNVTCTARRLQHLDEVLRRPSRSRVLRDEKYRVAALAARHVLFELPPQFIAGGKDTSTLGLHVVQTPIALYVFLYRHPGPPRPALEKTIHQVVESFRLLGTS